MCCSRIPLLLALLALALAPAGLHGQTPTPTTPAPGELQLVELSLGRAMLLERAQGKKVGSVDLLASNLMEVVSSSAEAARYAQIHERERKVGNGLIAAGALVSLGLLTSYVAQDELDMGGWESAAFMGGAAVASFGTYRLVVARRALHLSVEAFNRTPR